jgi:hypothetical protein
MGGKDSWDKNKEKYKYHFHQDLLPGPYCGDIKNAKVYLVGLNPGFSPDDYTLEMENTSYFKLLEDNIKQKINKYAFVPLNPDYKDGPASRWWRQPKMFGNIITKLQSKTPSENIDELLGKKICALELFPYHSLRMSTSGKLFKIESVKRMTSFIKKLYDDDSDEKLLIITRSVTNLEKICKMDLFPVPKKKKNLIIIPPTKARNVSLNPYADEIIKYI